jgi:two-component system OmpR family sensor kinase
MGGIADRLFPFRRLATWLGLLVVLVAAIALVLNALLILPSLSRDLEQEQIRDLERTALLTRTDLRTNLIRAQTGRGAPADAIVARFGQLSQSDIYVYRVDTDNLVVPVTAPRGPADSSVVREAAKATELGSLASGVDGRMAEVAYPVSLRGTRFVVLHQAPLGLVDRAVALTRDRVEIGAILGLIIAVTVGAIGAGLLTQRIRRLEQGARRIAAGDLTQPIQDPGKDEIADLAHAFDRMREELARTDAARRAFNANASHELRTPVFALAGYLELIEDEEPDPETMREFLASMRDQVDRLANLATDLLDLSRLDADTVAFAAEPVQLGEIATVLVRDLEPLALRRDAHLTAAAEPALAIGDDARVQQIVRVLIDNALRHNPKGIAITVRSETDAEGARIVVEDDGPPIPEAYVDEVFERFKRGAASGEGSGLGLAIAKELAMRMQGTLELDQTPPGKRFILTLPRDPQAVPSPA